jgi:hypothetical protein
MITIANYRFEGPYKTTTSLRDSAGIYVILDYRLNRKWYLLDVGESAKIKTRIENHERQLCWKRNRQGNIGVAILYTPRWSADQRRSLESKIRREYQPPCGDR